MTGKLVLVVDDEPQIRRAVRHALESAEVRVVEASTGQEGVNLTAAERPDLIVLDLGLPDSSGAQVCREIRKWSKVPIVVLSARHSDHEKVLLLDSGADDYITKPFSTVEFQARIRVQLRRSKAAEETEHPVVNVDGLCIDCARRVVSRDGIPVHLTPTEWDLLRAFVRHRGRTLTHKQLFREVWNHAAGDPQQYLRVHIANLRRKIERDSLRPRLITTEPGAGYRFEDVS
jgi:two-component system, OmpR family, KDP operon response regulator KdpE